MSDEIGKLYVTAASGHAVSPDAGCCGVTRRGTRLARSSTALALISTGFSMSFPIVALILTLTDAGALLIEALARSNDQQLAGAIIFLLTASIVGLNFFTDLLLSVLDPRIRKSIIR
ncbi:MAG: hypothetical protein CM15mP60_2870 [Alphaproteobacteria bacterium]|nr:MAG: hypothetical protein CM15mP60_2870 [Alphaproteobacteria bacterium]